MTISFSHQLDRTINIYKRIAHQLTTAAYLLHDGTHRTVQLLVVLYIYISIYLSIYLSIVRGASTLS